MSSEDIRPEYPGRAVCFLFLQTLYFTTPMINVHGTITPGCKGGCWYSRKPSQLTHRLTCMSYSLILMAAPGKHQGNCTETRSFSSCQQDLFIFFSTGGTEVSHSLTGGMLSSASFSSCCWSEDSLPKHCPGHTAVVPHTQAYFTRSLFNRTAEKVMARICFVVENFFYTHSQPKSALWFKENSSLTLHSCLTCTISHLTTNFSNTANSCHTYLWLSILHWFSEKHVWESIFKENEQKAE